MESRAGQHHAVQPRFGQRPKLGRPTRLQMIHAAKPEPDRRGRHSQGVELIGVDAARMPQLPGPLEEPKAVVQRPRALLAVGVNRCGWKRSVNRVKRLANGPRDERLVPDGRIKSMTDAGGH